VRCTIEQAKTQRGLENDRIQSHTHEPSNKKKENCPGAGGTSGSSNGIATFSVVLQEHPGEELGGCYVKSGVALRGEVGALGCVYEKWPKKKKKAIKREREEVHASSRFEGRLEST